MARIQTCLCVAMLVCSTALAGDCCEGTKMIKATDPGVVKAKIKSGNATDGWLVTYTDKDGKEQEVKVACDTKTCADCACGADTDKAKAMKEKYFVAGTPVLVKLNEKKAEMMVFDFAAAKTKK